ncbi:MAG: 50S ribosomal protein L1 [Halorhodospira halophila]|uniref:50S ribosomal protein L1 n=1 Tax=Halorhodospira TaxID=85108 RepID=UPI00191322C5|nr:MULTISPECIES: 50S ribosomal protein L1 [Halorhodospira]MBK5935572.1 50S ribosomal protein L1 [Halorhodospira halophila]MCC3750901.1 50S ribosomal protein L1 [Halorhodospira halophila]MCG5528949.1 50S ribosomal protein L1 [Halorhodospira halophila]MCG5539245.1 50S ribosomal protein L1 [Halorhodospira sp. 9622]MCG5541841.1 50S ribosomal protein L1 [Halorhodospira sp. M39old]
MAKLTKRQKQIRERVDRNQAYPVDEALALVKELATARFPESIDVAVNLGVDPRKSDQIVRGSTVLPNGTGKSMRVAVFAQGENADAAQAEGADAVGMDDLAERMQGGELDYDVVIASPDAMGVVGKLGPVLGPRGLMPNPKTGTVSADVAGAVRNAKAGQVRYRTDRGGVIHSAIGRANFDNQALRENLDALLADLNKLKPSTSKGVYIKQVTVSSTMGAGVRVDKGTLGV